MARLRNGAASLLNSGCRMDLLHSSILEEEMGTVSGTEIGNYGSCPEGRT